MRIASLEEMTVPGFIPLSLGVRVFIISFCMERSWTGPGVVYSRFTCILNGIWTTFLILHLSLKARAIQ